MDTFRTLFFCTRSQKGNFKPFPTKRYTLSLFESLPPARVGGKKSVGQMAADPGVCHHRRLARLRRRLSALLGLGALVLLLLKLRPRIKYAEDG